MNGDYVTGLFHGMFEGNILTFNPGWDQDGNLLDAYTGVRELQQELRDRGITLDDEGDDATPDWQVLC